MTTQLVMLALLLSVFALPCAAQGAGRQSAAPGLTSEDLLDRRPAYSPAPGSARISISPASASSRLTPAGNLYRDPAGAFSLNLPSGSWHVNAKSQSSKGRLSSQRVFRKLDADGFASATASVYVLPSTAGFPFERAAGVDTSAQRTLAEVLAARFLSSSASVVYAEPVSSGARSGLQVIADQTVSRRVVVRALIYAFAQGGQLFVVVCRAPLESFDAQALEFSAITQSLASTVVRSS